MSLVIQTFQNNLSSNLYAVPSIYYMVTTLEDSSKFKENEY